MRKLKFRSRIVICILASIILGILCMKVYSSNYFYDIYYQLNPSARFFGWSKVNIDVRPILKTLFG